VEAIDTAAAAGVPLKLAGIVQDQEYFDTQVAPRLMDDGCSSWARSGRGSVGVPGGALALLHLINFDEPFGFSVVEAMACGTPVIAFDRAPCESSSKRGRRAAW